MISLFFFVATTTVILVFSLSPVQAGFSRPPAQNNAASSAKPAGCPDGAHYDENNQCVGDSYNEPTTNSNISTESAPVTAPVVNNTCNALQAKVRLCENTSNDAKTACDSEKDSTLQSTAREVQDKASMADQLIKAAGVNGGCSIALQAVSTMAGVWDSFQTSCKDSIDKCSTTCEKIQNDLIANDCPTTSLDKSLAVCNSQKAVAKKATNYVASIQQMVAQTQACKAQLSGQPIPQTCFTNPNTPECVAMLGNGDCSDPKMASGVVCACRNGMGSTACQQAMNTQNSASSTGNLSNASTHLTAPTSNTGEHPDFSNIGLDNSASGANDNKPGEDPGGRMGGAARIDKGGGGAPMGDSAGGGKTAGAPINTNVNGGIGRGGGGGGAWGGGYSNNDGANRAAGGGGGAGAGSPNFDKYRPHLAYQGGRRELAGVVGPDGLLGPHADFWQTIKNRYNYEYQQGTLKP
jgi:hypothetical protein